MCGGVLMRLVMVPQSISNFSIASDVHKTCLPSRNVMRSMAVVKGNCQGEVICEAQYPNKSSKNDQWNRH